MKTPMYEAHIAIPEIPEETAEQVLQRLCAAGITEYDYFLQLINLDYDGQPCPINPATHDIDNPMIITSTIFDTRRGAVQTILAGMKVLKEHQIDSGNFELEAGLNGCGQAHPTIADFPGFVQQGGAPAFEAHILWEGQRSNLPSEDDVVKCHQNIFGYSPNQIADFALTQRPKRREIIWRVSTVYQATREATLEFRRKVEANMREFPNAKGVIAEQICVVSEPKGK